MSKAKWKTSLLMLLCACLLILGAVLPGLLGHIQENHYQPGFAAMHSVELDLHGEVSLKEMLSIISNSTNTLEVSGDVAVRTEEEILDLAQERLQPFLDAGLIVAPGLDVRSQTYSCKPYLTVWEGEEAASVICWQVLIQFDEEEPALVLGLEDQTGALVVLDYQYSKLEFYPSYFAPDVTMETLSGLYLSGLGGEFAQDYPEVVNTYTDDGSVRTQHGRMDWETEFGPAGISFDAWPFGITVTLF